MDNFLGQDKRLKKKKEGGYAVKYKTKQKDNLV